MTTRHRGPDHDDPGAAARVEAVLSALRDTGGRVTTGRRAIVQALYGAGDHHITADDLARAVQADHPDVHLSTVYRTLESLEALGIVTRVTLGHGPVVFHLADHAHHHLRCERCGSVVEIPGDLVAPLARSVAVTYGFTLAPSHLVLAGVCDDCASRESDA